MKRILTLPALSAAVTLWVMQSASAISIDYIVTLNESLADFGSGMMTLDDVADAGLTTSGGPVLQPGQNIYNFTSIMGTTPNAESWTFSDLFYDSITGSFDWILQTDLPGLSVGIDRNPAFINNTPFEAFERMGRRIDGISVRRASVPEGGSTLILLSMVVAGGLCGRAGYAVRRRREEKDGQACIERD